jgi:hypothetical protein
MTNTSYDQNSAMNCRAENRQKAGSKLWEDYFSGLPPTSTSPL